MKSLFDDVSVKCSKLTTRAYSTSFSLGIYFLNHRLRDAIYSIYGFVRLADEIVDSFHSYDKEYLLAKFKQETYEAIKTRISLNPILNSFQHAVHQYNISTELIETFLRSMQMDLEKVNYNSEKYNQYILGSAEVVGLMCLQVFTENDTQLYKELKPYAMKLGAAFQKVNFLRDVKTDYEQLNRTYFPKVDFKNFTLPMKLQIEKEIAKDFSGAYNGILQLPIKARFGVYVAYKYYLSLFKKIKKTKTANILEQRIRIPNYGKVLIVAKAGVRKQLNIL